MLKYMITVVNSSNDHGENENDGEDDQGLAKSDLRLRNMQLSWIGVLTWAFTPNWVRLFAATKARLGRFSRQTKFGWGNDAFGQKAKKMLL